MAAIRAGVQAGAAERHSFAPESARHREPSRQREVGSGTGQLYRSTELSHLHGEDLEQFAKLGISAAFDMRTAPERAAEPDVVPEGTEQVVCDVLKDSQSAAPAQLMKVLSDWRSPSRCSARARRCRCSSGAIGRS